MILPGHLVMFPHWRSGHTYGRLLGGTTQLIPRVLRTSPNPCSILPGQLIHSGLVNVLLPNFLGLSFQGGLFLTVYLHTLHCVVMSNDHCEL